MADGPNPQRTKNKHNGRSNEARQSYCALDSPTGTAITFSSKKSLSETKRNALLRKMADYPSPLLSPLAYTTLPSREASAAWAEAEERKRRDGGGGGQQVALQFLVGGNLSSTTFCAFFAAASLHLFVREEFENKLCKQKNPSRSAPPLLPSHLEHVTVSAPPPPVDS